MNIVEEEDVESNSHFECKICYEKSQEQPTKYKCSTCDGKICDSCFLKQINGKKKKCVFCRGDLEINQDDIKFDIGSNYNRLSIEIYRRNRWKIFFLIIILFIWYTIFLSYLFISAKKKNK